MKNSKLLKTLNKMDSNKTTLYGKIIDLRNIQIELKCESEVEETREAEVEKSKDDAKEELANLIFNRKMLFTYYMLSDNNQEAHNSAFINSLFRDIAQKNPSPLTYYMYDGGYSFNFSDCTSSTPKLQNFAKNCVAYAQEHPDQIDQLTFSVIPGFFEYFWCDETNLKFRDFISFVIDEDRGIASKFSRVIYASTELFYNVFDLFVKNESQIPNFISKSFIQKKYLPNADICIDIFNLKSYSQENRSKNHLTATFCSSKISQIIEMKDEFYFFTELDIKIISCLIKSDNQVLFKKSPNNDYVVYRFEPPTSKFFNPQFSKSSKPAAPFNNTQFLNKNNSPRGVYSLTLKGPVDIFKRSGDDLDHYSIIYSESSNMSYLRKLLVKFPTIQIIAANNIDDIRISTILAKQVCLARDEDRLLFEKQIEQLRKIEDEEGNTNKWKITSTTQRLRECLNERRHHFQKVVSEISKVHNLITKIENMTIRVKKESQFFREKIEINIIKNWEKTNEFAASVKNFQKLPKFSKFQKDNIKMRSNFSNIWENIYKDFHVFLSTNGYSIKFPMYLIHDSLFSFFPFSDFLCEKEVLRKESDFFNTIQKQKNEIKQYCNSGHKETISKEDFLLNAFFMEKMKKLFNIATNEQTPLKQIFAFSELFKYIELVFTQIYTELNNEDVLKFFVLFIVSLDKLGGRLKPSYDYIFNYLWFDSQSELNEEVFGDDYFDISIAFKYINDSISIIENLSLNGEKK